MMLGGAIAIERVVGRWCWMIWGWSLLEWTGGMIMWWFRSDFDWWCCCHDCVVYCTHTWYWCIDDSLVLLGGVVAEWLGVVQDVHLLCSFCEYNSMREVESYSSTLDCASKLHSMILIVESPKTTRVVCRSSFFNLAVGKTTLICLAFTYHSYNPNEYLILSFFEEGPDNPKHFFCHCPTFPDGS